MNQVQSRSKIREVEIQCSICNSNFVTKIFPDRTYQGGNCFGKTSFGKGKKSEYWECDKCFKE